MFLVLHPFPYVYKIWGWSGKWFRFPFFWYLELEVHSTIGILSVAHKALILHPRHKPVNLRLELYHQVGSSWVLQVCHCWYTEFMPLIYSNPHWHYFIRESVVVGHIDTVLYCAVKSLMRSSCLYSRLLAKVEIPPLHITKIGVPTLLNIIKCRNWAKAPNRTKSF